MAAELGFQDLVNSYARVERLANGLVRCTDETPARTGHAYFRLGDADHGPAFTLSDNFIDDDFAAQTLAQPPARPPATLAKLPFGPNRRSFTHLLHVPVHFHRELGGRLDAQRNGATLIIPIFAFEFSGSETLDDFFEMRRRHVDTRDWRRPGSPKILLRFDNSRTRGGADSYVLAGFDLVLREVDNLVGVRPGFIEVINYRGEVVELVFDQGETFRWIVGRDDAHATPVASAAVRERLWSFLTR